MELYFAQLTKSVKNPRRERRRRIGIVMRREVIREWFGRLETVNETVVGDGRRIKRRGVGESDIVWKRSGLLLCLGMHDVVKAWNDVVDGADNVRALVQSIRRTWSIQTIASVKFNRAGH